jgi:hypothetical protein
MRRPRFVTRSSRIDPHIDRMDLVAIFIGVAMFAILLWMIEGIDRV